MFHCFKSPKASKVRRRSPNRFARRSVPIRLEALEDRLAPAVINVTNLADGGPGSGSLRAAILQSNSTTGPNTINLMTPGTYQLSLTGTSHDGTNGALQITNQSVTITNASGSIVTIDGGGVDRVFDIEGSISGGVTFNGVTITGGIAEGGHSNKGTDPNGLTGAGGAIYSPQTDVTLTSCQIINNLANAEGGGIWTDTGSVTLSSSSIKGNDAGLPGGGIYSLAGQVSVNSSSLSDNVSDGEGGGIEHGSGQGLVSVSGSDISGNSAGGSGGGIALDASQGGLNISNSTILDNIAGTFADSSGGGVWQDSTSATSSVSNCTISGNTASGTGGGLAISASNLTITACTIDGNFGGGVSALLGSGTGILNVSNSTIDGNYASSTSVAPSPDSAPPSAGGLGVYCATLIVSNSSINNNRAAGSGGGVEGFITNGTFTNVNVIGNHSGHGDGGIGLNPGLSPLGQTPPLALSMSNCNISDNFTANTYGGIDVGDSLIANGIFTVAGANVALSDCTINGNHAGFGVGGINFNGTSLTMTSCTISNNTSGANAGGLNVDTSAGGSIKNCTISDNWAATTGGGISIRNSSNSSTPLVVTDCTISGNRAGEDGAGVFDGSNQTVVVDFFNDTISGNSAAGFGGGIAIESAGAKSDVLTAVTISNNSAASGGGACVLPGAPAPVAFDTIIAGNHANAGAGPDVFGKFTDVGHNLIGVEDAACTSFTNGTLNDQVGTVASPINPLLGPLENNGGPTFTMILRPGSPAINAGGLGGFPSTDQRGFPRPGAGQNAATIGAVETQLPSFLGTSANRAYVENLYETLLGRTADPGAAGFVTMLNNGASRATVIADIVHSTEYETDQVQGLYTTYLHRPADTGGLQHFVGVLNSGGTVEQVAEALVSSPEYFQLHGRVYRQNGAFLTALYYDALGRGGSPAEQAGFLQALDGGTMSRAQVAAAIFGSAEYQQDLVEHYYQEFLGRYGDPAGLAAWEAQLKVGMTDAQLAAALLGSGEAFAKRS
jgi:parallel beta-helix repeat protein